MIKCAIDFFLSALGLHCCAGFHLVVVSGGSSLVVVHGLLIAEASFVPENRL